MAGRVVVEHALDTGIARLEDLSDIEDPTERLSQLIRFQIEVQFQHVRRITGLLCDQIYGVENGYGFWVLYDTDGSILEDYFVEKLGDLNYDAAQDAVHIPNAVAVQRGVNEAARIACEAIEASGLKDGMTIGTHHHLRNGDALLGVEVRVSVGLRHAAVRRPPRMRDTDASRRRLIAHQLFQPTDPPPMFVSPPGIDQPLLQVLNLLQRCPSA